MEIIVFKIKTIFLLVSVVLTGCASNSVSWDSLEENNAGSNYCSTAFTKPEKIKSCSVEYTVYSKAKRECQKDSNPGYCVLMAEYSWDTFKDMVLNVEPTQEHAKMFPIMCGHKDKAVQPCSKL